MKLRHIMLGLALPLAIAGAARADDNSDVENRLRQQLRATVTQLRELQDSQATLQAQKAAAEQERDTLKARARPAGPSRKQLAEIGSLRRQAASARADADALRQSIAQSQAEAAGLRQQLDEANEALRQLRQAQEQTQATLASNQSTLEACKAKNVELIKLGNEVLERYERAGIADAVVKKEPFTGLKRVRSGSEAISG